MSKEKIQGVTCRVVAGFQNSIQSTPDYDEVLFDNTCENNGDTIGLDNYVVTQKTEENMNSASGNGDIEDEQKLKIERTRIRYNLEKLNNILLKNPASNLENYITPEIKTLFSEDKPEVSYDEICNSDGTLKKGFELFDLNSDGKIDDLEKSYFSSGGSMLNIHAATLHINNLADVIHRLDMFDNKNDTFTSINNRKTLYRFMSLANDLIEELKDFPAGMQEQYTIALASINEVSLNDMIHAGGAYSGTSLSMNNFANENYFKDVLFHELTHCVLDSNKEVMVEAITQEVQTHFLESRYYAYKNSNGSRVNFGRDYPKFLSQQYAFMERENPDITKLDIAKAVFMVNRFDEYSSNYAQKDKDKYIYNAKYYDIGGYFREPSNKKDIYRAGIQKAFMNASLKDENGNELITDEVRNLFSPERPIVTYHDLVDENDNIKNGLELFDLDGDGKLYNEKKLFSYITYNDIPRLISVLDEWGNLSPKNKLRSTGVKATDRVSTTASREYIAEILYNTDYSDEIFNFHKSNRARPKSLY